MVNRTVYVSLFIAAFVSAVFFLFTFSETLQDQFKAYSSNGVETTNFVSRKPQHHSNESYANAEFIIPLVVHHTWKKDTPPPAETVRWRSGCQVLNPEYDFRMYNDEDLLEFTTQYYPRYLPMFKTLHGVCK